tara:strand:- start:441 stop:635 length:195 start_codon:yes stop_codon:yes gene_type:complete
MGKFRKIITINDTLYECLGVMSVESSNEKGTDYWKKQWGADTVLRNGNDFFYCRTVLDAEFDDI